jgi:RNA polymerase sigma factor (sigma-70 family)
MHKPDLKPIGPSLVKSLKKGNEKAFEILFDHFAPKVYGLSLKSGFTHEDAEGIVQEVFLKIWQRKNDLNPDLSLNAYLYKIANSMIIRKRKRQLLEQSYLRMKAHQDASSLVQDGEEKVIYNDLKGYAEELIETLPKSQKEVFLTKHKENLSLDQIAETLKVPKRRVENQITRTNKTLKTKLSLSKWGMAGMVLLILFQIYY